MLERYTRVFLQQGRMYCPGAPVVIEAGALLKDTQTGNIIAQVKFKSISPKKIFALTVRIFAKDYTGADLEGVDSFRYLDLNVCRGEEFGGKIPIVMPDANVRAFICECVSATFSDGTIWNCDEGVTWTSLPIPMLLKDKIGTDLAEQFQNDTKTQSEYVPSDHADLWYCGCGMLNHSYEQFCYGCKVKKADLLNALNIDILKVNKKQNDSAKAKRKKRIIIGSIAATSIIIALVLLAFLVIIPKQKYDAAVAMLNEGKYAEAAITFGSAGNYSDAKEMSRELWNQIAVRDTIFASDTHTIGLQTDGTVVATTYTGIYYHTPCDVSNWSDIIAISAGNSHIVGLKSNGTVVATGDNNYGQCYVGKWKDIVAISAGNGYTVGLRSDGTVVATGNNRHGQCNVSDWTNIIAVSASAYHTIGLCLDGTVVATTYKGDQYSGQCDVGRWKDIVAISAGNVHTVGLRSDGTVVATGNNRYGQCNVSDWTNIVAVCAGNFSTVGLKSDGTVVATGNNHYGQCNVSDWTNIVAISSEEIHTVGLKSDGTVVVTEIEVTDFTKDRGLSLCDVLDWKDIKLP